MISVQCLGNELAGDDGIGIRIGRVLQSINLPTNVRVELKQTIGLDLLDTLQIEILEKLILVDAMRIGIEPGECKVLQVSNQELKPRNHVCAHGFGLAEILEIARKLMADKLPAQTIVIGIEIYSAERFCTKISKPLLDTIPSMVEMVLREIDASEQLLQAGRIESLRWLDWSLKLTEAYGG